MSPRGVWIGASGLSLAVHAGALVGFGWMTSPDPVEDQPIPLARISVEAREVDRVDARPTEAAMQRANQTPAPSRPAVQGAVAQSQALAITAPVVPATTSAPQSEAIATTLPPSPVSAALTAVAASLASVSPGQQFASALDLPTPPPIAAEAVLTPTPLTAATALTAESVAQINPTGAVAPTRVPWAVPAAQHPAPSAPGLTLDLPQTKATASLAWTGDGAVAPASLAAIQAFMQSGDLDRSDSSIGDVRDGIAAVLAAVPCARLQTTFIPETGALELRGHVPEDALRGPVLEALRAQVGAAIAVQDQLLILPRPQCGALSGIADVGLPQSTEQLTNPRVIGADGFARNYSYMEGERLELDITAPDYDSFVYVDYFTADGMVFHLQPNQIVPLEFALAKSPLSVGRDRGGAPALDITVSPPFGQEIAVAFAASVPLYDGLRPLQEPAEPYLAFLKERVALARTTLSDFKGEWVYFFISTRAR